MTSSEDIKHAALLLEGLERYKQLLVDIADMEIIGLPVITLSTKKSIRIELPRQTFVNIITANMKQITDELDDMGVSYE